MKIFSIKWNDADQRLDKFLKKLFPLATRWLIYKLNRKEKIKISSDGMKFKKQDNEYKLQIWEQVKIFLTDEDFEILQQKPEKQQSFSAEKSVVLKQDIVYEDASLLVMNKNPWINVHPWENKSKEASLIEIVHDYLWDKFSSLTFRPSLVHRLDRDTSWIVIIAKKKDILTRLVNDFKTHNNIKKIYFALVLWKMPAQSWKIEEKLSRTENAHNENKVKIDKDWKEAITYYKVLKEHIFKTKNGEEIISELEIEIQTGRMHQIRVHLANLLNPIIGDKVYWNKSFNHYICQEFGFCRQALHAWKLEFFHYERNKKILLEARLKEDMKNFIDKL